MKTEILKLLKECDRYVSGQELCDHFKVSRTAVWKIINQLKKEGYRIDAVRNRGYRLVESADVITVAELESRMKPGLAGSHIEYWEEIDSTNNRVKRLGEEGALNGTLVTADCQTAGRGRRGRSWVSDKGTGIWMSLLLRPDIPPVSASMLTLAAALAVAAGIGEATGLNARIKWPNDIVIRKRKVCGILTEMSAESDHVHYVVIGIGINANTKQFPQDLQNKATSLYLEGGKTVIRSHIITLVMAAFNRYYESFLKTGDLSLLLDEYQGKLANKGQEVLVMSAGGDYKGFCLGVDETGELLVQMQDGTVKRVVSGEVSVRGIYGYA